MDIDRARYCREIETYLCRKNEGHLIRVVGPSFELVSGWAAQGVPVRVAFTGIDRYFERYYRKGPRRRPIKIDFCEADVLATFDEWRRAIGLPATRALVPLDTQGGETDHGRRSPSLPAHLERAVLRLTSARANGSLGTAFDAVIDHVARELDLARAEARGVRGEVREALLGRLAALDAELLHTARAALDDAARAALVREADEELAGFRDRMVADAFARARGAAVERLIRERFALPVLAFP